MRHDDRQRGCNRSVEGREFAPEGPTLLIIACLLLTCSALTASVCTIGTFHNCVEKIDNIPFYVLEQKKGM